MCGYGIRYRHGLFRQKIADGWQAEFPRPGSSTATPGEFDRRGRPTKCFGGLVEFHEANGSEERFVWKPAEKVIATAYDTPIVGWRATA